MQVIIISGLSGSGKSIALNALEDDGFYCIDNLPVTLLSNISRHLDHEHQDKVAISVDIRSIDIEKLPQVIKEIESSSIKTKLIYLESSTESIVRRFGETRRKHPLFNEKLSLSEAIEKERVMLAPLSEIGYKIDTSNITVYILKAILSELIQLKEDHLALQFSSFGYKFGIPLDADFIFDVRCLPNPHYEAHLKDLTGIDKPIAEFFQTYKEVEKMYLDINYFITEWLGVFKKDQRHSLHVAIGCTGGKHRSVYIANKLFKNFSNSKSQVIIRHRDINY
ncbi:MAG: RNase adapter RapZ [Candidatus Methylopumilus sp.]|nr:RNase adapter RapZ [Candidatus Methylopumilus sp.]